MGTALDGRYQVERELGAGGIGSSGIPNVMTNFPALLEERLHAAK